MRPCFIAASVIAQRVAGTPIEEVGHFAQGVVGVLGGALRCRGR